MSRPVSHDFVVRLWMIAAGLVVVGAFIAAVLLSGCTPKSQGYFTPDGRGAVTAGKVVYPKGPQPEWCADVHADGTCEKALRSIPSNSPGSGEVDSTFSGGCLSDNEPLRVVPCKPKPAPHRETCREMVDRVSRESHITLSVVCLPEKR